jgi:extradiol dioxygenase family protein
MSKLSKSGLLIISSLIIAATNAQAECTDCATINGEKVYLKEVGTVLGDYDYVRLANGKKVAIPYQVIPKMTIAMTLGLPVYISQAYSNYTILNED